MRGKISKLLLVAVISILSVLAFSVSLTETYAATNLTVESASYLEDIPAPSITGNCTRCHDYLKHSVNNCIKCHDAAIFEPGAGPEGGHGGLNVSDTSKTISTAPVGNCLVCHTYLSSVWGPLCMNCHPSYWAVEGPLPQLIPDANPDWPLDYTHDATRLNDYPSIVEYNLIYKCETCHDQNWWNSIPKQHTSANFGTVAQHTYAALSTECQQCHNSVLTIEHYQWAQRKNIELNCYTCHSSPSINIKQAISNGDKNCSACHGTAGDHQVKHQVSLQGCQNATCHAPDLMTDHKKHNIDCSGCHQSANSKVTKAILSQNKNCNACHSLIHDLGSSQTVPSVIDLYPGVQWSSPMPLSIWQGERWVEENPSDFQIIMSSRKDINPLDVHTFYKNNLESKGWTLNSSVTDENSILVKATFVKGNNTIIIRSYNSEGPLGEVNSQSGYRIEIIYNL